MRKFSDTKYKNKITIYYSPGCKTGYYKTLKGKHRQNTPT